MGCGTSKIEEISITRPACIINRHGSMTSKLYAIEDAKIDGFDLRKMYDRGIQDIECNQTQCKFIRPEDKFCIRVISQLLYSVQEVYQNGKQIVVKDGLKISSKSFKKICAVRLVPKTEQKRTIETKKKIIKSMTTINIKEPICIINDTIYTLDEATNSDFGRSLDLKKAYNNNNIDIFKISLAGKNYNIRFVKPQQSCSLKIVNKSLSEIKLYDNDNKLMANNIVCSPVMINRLEQ
jgi:hypothetical protein